MIFKFTGHFKTDSATFNQKNTHTHTHTHTHTACFLLSTRPPHLHTSLRYLPTPKSLSATAAPPQRHRHTYLGGCDARMFERRKFLVGEPPSPLATVASSTVSTCASPRGAVYLGCVPRTA